MTERWKIRLLILKKMRPDIEKLLVIQNRDQRLHAIRAGLKTIPGEIAARRVRIEAMGGKVDALKSRLQDIEVRRNKLEVEVQSKQASIAKFRTQQQQTRKNDEYQALANEIERYGSDISTLEDQELELMEEADAVQKELKAATAFLDADKAKVETVIADLEAKAKTLKDQEKATLEERKGLAVEIDEDLMAIYDRLMQSKKDAAVVSLEHDVCTGCHMKLTTQTAVKVRGGNAIVHCENCGRILYEGE